jgi:UDP-N-acetylglucosamine:LPS N-acetylglucosamine transferase
MAHDTRGSPLPCYRTGANHTEGDRVAAQPTKGHEHDIDSTDRVLLVGSSGGHLAQLVTLKPWWEGRDRAWVTFESPHALSLLEGEQVDFAYFPTTRNVPNLVRNFWVAARVLIRRRPDLVVSTGAAVAIPFFVIARILGIKTVYVEVYDRIDSRTVSGRICRPLSSAFLVQWEAQREMYPGSIVIGGLL